MMDCLGTESDDENENCPRDRCTCSNEPYQRFDEPSSPDPETVHISFKFDKKELYYTVPVERDLCVVDLSEILAIHFQVPNSGFYAIYEEWVNKGVERILEDHELMLEVYLDMKRYVKKEQGEVKYHYRQNLNRYDFYSLPDRVFDKFSLLIEDESWLRKSPETYVKTMVENGDCPTCFFVLEEMEKGKKKKSLLLLRNKKLYLTTDQEMIHHLFRLSTKINRKTSLPKPDLRVISEDEIAKLTVIAHLSEVHIYINRVTVDWKGKPLNTSDQDKKKFDKPQFHILLRPITTKGERIPKKSILHYVCFDDPTRLNWITAMRLAKYGKQLRENYKQFKSKQAELNNAKEYGAYNVPNTSDMENISRPSILERESVRSRVAMDFTGKTGRIVEDPVEANEIALAEGYMWQRRHKTATRRPVSLKPNENQVDVGVHTMQPWFHSNLTRDQASTLVTKYGNGDGVFIVRPSRTSEGTYVLTYKCQGKLVHQQIVAMVDRERNITVFTLDNGQTKFYDILQLIEFYTMNPGTLMCRLTHYITENANIHNPNVSSPSNAPEYVSVAVNTEISMHNNTENANHLPESPSGSSKTTSSRSLSPRCSPN